MVLLAVQKSDGRASSMTINIREVFSPLLIISYVFGIRIVKFPAGEPRAWLSFLYILLLWLLYCFLLEYTVIHYIHDSSIEYISCFWLNICIALLSVGLGVYYDKKYRSCLKKLAIVDDTLKKIGTMTDYQRLYTRVLLVVLGWFAFVIWIIINSTLWYMESYNVIKSVYIAFILSYSTCVNLIDDLIITLTLGYIGLKFDQINEHLRKMESDNKPATKRAWEQFVMLQPRHRRYPKFASNEHVTWIVIHLYLELRKISRELNSIFGLQMTVKMGIYFAFIALGFRQLFNLIFINFYIDKTKLYINIVISFLVVNIFRLLIINYMCEKVSIKANAIGDVTNIIPYSTCDAVVRENISQLILQVNLAPLKFYGLGLFQFGWKFFYGFSSSVTTVIVILVQSYTTT